MTALKKATLTIHPSWLDLIGKEFGQPYMQNLARFLEEEAKAGQIIYPQSHEIFKALRASASETRVVILGQDPYHGPGQANGLAFSVHPDIKIPPSLRNIYKEVYKDDPASIPKSGDLSQWAEQGVLLLNTSLTVRATLAGSHQKRGWEAFTDAVIIAANENCNHLVFMLWGSHAQRKSELINKKKHLVLEAPHPSPLSAHRGFLGCNHFVEANTYLKENGLPPIDWTGSLKQ